MEMIISKQIRKLMEKLMLDDRGGLRFWARAFPWVVMTWLSVLVAAFTWSLVR